MSRETLLIISFSDLGRDARVHRQIRFLHERYRIIAAGLGEPRIEGVQFVPLQRIAKGVVGKARSTLRLLSRRFESYYWDLSHVRQCLAQLLGLSADLVIANDLEALPVALRIAGMAPVVFDAHEYAPRQFEDRLSFRVFFQALNKDLCGRYIPRVHGMMTVSEGIARQYAADTGVQPIVVTNAPEFEELQPQPVGQQGRIRLVHHGAASPSRRIENMIRIMDYLDDRFELDLLLVAGPARYRARLRGLAERNPRVRLLDPVPMLELPRFLNQYDIGLAIFEPVTFNLRHTLPNKFFEFVQARIAVAVGPSLEMARLVEEHRLGIVARDFSPEAMADRIRACEPAEIERFKRRAHEAAPLLSAASNREKVLGLVAGVLDGARVADPEL